MGDATSDVRTDAHFGAAWGGRVELRPSAAETTRARFPSTRRPCDQSHTLPDNVCSYSPAYGNKSVRVTLSVGVVTAKLAGLPRRQLGRRRNASSVEAGSGRSL